MPRQLKYLLAVCALLMSLGAPVAGAVENRDGVAVIIGNRTYASSVPAVKYAFNDAEAIKRLVTGSLGYRAGNVIDLRDATYAQLRAVFGNETTPEGKLFQFVRPGRSDVVVFYSGHGVPGLKDKRGYILPVDADPDNPELNGYPLDLLFDNLAKIEARSVTVFIDACFSGASDGGMLIESASPVFIKGTVPVATGAMTVITAAQGSQLASWDHEARHGLFTEHLLQAFYGKADGKSYGNGDGRITAREIKAYLDDEMTYAARRRYNRHQKSSLMGPEDRVLATYAPGQFPERPSLARTAPAPEIARKAPSLGPASETSIGIPSFFGGSDQERALGKKVAKIISADLSKTGRYRIIDPGPYVNVNPNEAPPFEDWRYQKAVGLVHGRVKKTAGGQLRMEFRLWDVEKERQIIGQALSTEPGNWRRVAHKIADSIHKKQTGMGALFDSRVVYVSQSFTASSGSKPVRRLAIMDQDGGGHRYLTDGRFPSFYPAVSPKNTDIAYVGFYPDRLRLFIFNIETGRQEAVPIPPGKPGFPRFSPDGRKIAFSLTGAGGTDIHLVDLVTRQARRLTEGPLEDFSPSFSPDGTRIVFSSRQRGGLFHLSVMDANGRGRAEIDRGSGSYSFPSWSPKGDLIAFIKEGDGPNHLGIIRPDGSAERLLAQGVAMSPPAWAPNGEMLLFAKPDGSPAKAEKLFTIGIDGHSEHPVPTPAHATQADWTPLNP